MGAGGMALLPACVWRADGWASACCSWMWRTMEGYMVLQPFFGAEICSRVVVPDALILIPRYVYL